MDWIRDHGWEAWLIAGLVLAGAELATLDLTLLMLGIGALTGSLVAAFGVPLVFQVLVAVAAALALLGIVRPNIVHRMHGGPTLETGPKRLLGKTGIVLEQVTVHNGRVKLMGEVWSARAIDEFTTIDPGHTVGVAEIDGATAVVFPMD